jgi:hypothetical protein
MRNQSRYLTNLGTVGLFLFIVPWAMASAQTTSCVLPQLVFGGGWDSTLYFTNQNNVPASIAVNFFTDAGAPLRIPTAGGTSAMVNLPAYGTAAVMAPDAGSLYNGYATFVLPSGVVGYGVLRQITGRQTSHEAVVPFSNVAATINTLVWDDTNAGAQTQVAIVNPGTTSTVVAITALDSQGNTLGTSSLHLAGLNKTVTTLESLPGLSGMFGNRGSARFVASTGNVSVLGLRFDGVAFSSIPVASDVPLGDPVPFNTMHINTQFQPLNLPLETVNFSITSSNDGSTYTAVFPQGTTLVNGAVTNQQNGSVTLTFTTLQSLPNTWYTAFNVVIPDVFTSTLTLTITQVSTDPATGVAIGNVNGLLTVSGTGLSGGQLSLSGPVFGTYVEPGPTQ